ncbi:MAG: hypothetical protein DRJ42_25875, partial [Deltaproteobacteria bacterium]
MDVTCERCGTEYEFDETLVSDRGTTVKCTQCGHLFKVFRPGGDDGPRAWSVRTKDGKVQHLSSLRDLQRLITQGKLTKTDEISRSGESWKLLGDIAELITFFSAAEATETSTPPRKDRTLPFTSQVGGGPFKRSPSAPRMPAARPAQTANQVPEAPSRGSGSGPLPAPPAAPPPRQPQPPSPTIPDRRSKVGTVLGLGEEPTLPATATPSPSETSPKQPHKQTLFGMGVKGASKQPQASAPTPDLDAAGATVPDAGAAERAKDSASFDEQATEIEQRPAGARTGDRSVGRLEGLGGPDHPVMPSTPTGGVVPTTRSMPKMAAPDPEPAPRTKSNTRDGYSDPAKTTDDRQSRKKASTPAPQKRGMYVDEDAELAARRDKSLPGEKKRTGLWVSLVILLAAAGGVALAWDKVGPMLGLVETVDPAAEFVSRGEAAIALDHQAAYEDAIEEFTEANGVSERDVAVLTGLCRAHGALAQELAFRASDLAARSAVDTENASLAGEAATLRREQTSHADDARRFGEDAVRIDPNDISAIVALADALRLTGDLGGAQSHLDRARTLESQEPDESDELRYVSALFTLPTPEAPPGPALDASRSAATAAPTLHRARLLYARALLATGDVAGARGEVDAVLGAVSGHPRAQRLRDAMDQGIPPAAPVVAALDGGTADAGTVTVADTGPPPSADPASPIAPVANTGTPSGEGSAPPRGRDYGWYVEHGDELAERGDIGRARAMYEAALAKRPGGSEAETGLGYVMLETGNANAAVGRFQAAARHGYAAAFIGLGDAYRRLHQNDNALAAYRDYLSRLPNGPAAYTARRQIEQLSAHQ